MSKVLIIDYEKCVGCRQCEIVCSAKHEGEFNPFLSRIHVVKWPDRYVAIPVVCAQCESALCSAVCPVEAISRNGEVGRVEIDYNVCIGCRMCLTICPFGAISFHTLDQKVIKCDLCDGDPACVEACVYKALQYLDVSEKSIKKQRATAEQLLGIMQRIASAMATVQCRSQIKEE